MRPIFGKRSPMNGVASLSRNAAVALVEREERRTGSRMLAYEIVAQTVGTSAEWIRKFVRGEEAKEPRLTLGFNIMTVYRQVCERVERAAESEHQLKEEIDAALKSIGVVVDGTQGSHGGSTETGIANQP